MYIHSLGYRTDLIFPRFDGEILDKEGYAVIRTPENPTYYWGNFLLFATPPALGDFDRWRDLFHREIGFDKRIGHYAFGWDTTDGETGEITPFLEAGFHVDTSVVLTAQQVQYPPQGNDTVMVRPLENDDDWAQATENQIDCRDEMFSEEGYRAFKSAQMTRYRRMQDAGLGAWFGAFSSSRLVGDCGVFVDKQVGNRVARFQSVEVHPDARRQGVCGTMIFYTARYALDILKADTLVMVADPEYHAARIYESVGFTVSERQIGMSWWQG